MLLSMGLQRVGHDWATEPNPFLYVSIYFFLPECYVHSKILISLLWELCLKYKSILITTKVLLPWKFSCTKKKKRKRKPLNISQKSTPSRSQTKFQNYIEWDPQQTGQIWLINGLFPAIAVNKGVTVISDNCVTLSYWRWEEKGTTEDEMVGWHDKLNGRESE